MNDLWKKIGSLMGKDKPQASTPAPSSDYQADRWNKVCEARAKFYSEQIGPLPQDILRIGHMVGVWPGGGLYVIPGTG